MEKTEIYSSKKKAFLLLIISLIFVIGGIYLVLLAQDHDLFREKSPFVLKCFSILLVLLGALGVFLSIKRLIKNQLILLIDSKGISINPEKAFENTIEWKSIVGFSECKIHNHKIVLIRVNNVEHHIEKESNSLRKKVMKFNANNYGSPFTLTTDSMQINHSELLKVLNENFDKYNR
ncbi:STM3941 family protein [Flavobacterium sp.]|uniref:STM3941 family protein n=1 Tax=Flavobacterium sp. TaxID=239 RepID=UPI002624E54F|nr:STM3941 family protein [Flavobacterium sp.]